jgi:hypothetical protein
MTDDQLVQRLQTLETRFEAKLDATLDKRFNELRVEMREGFDHPITLTESAGQRLSREIQALGDRMGHRIETVEIRLDLHRGKMRAS